MSFDSFSEFLAMGGHGLYVWLCYGAGFIVLSLNYVLPAMRRKSLLRELYQLQRRDNKTTDPRTSESVNEGLE